MAPIAVFAYQHIGEVTPSDPFLFVGERLRLYCNITNGNVTEDSSTLFFEKDNERISSENLSSRAILFTVPKVELSDQASYVCILRTLKGTFEIVGHQKVKVDFPPRKVVKEECRVYNWESMTCTWDLGVHYNHSKHVNVSVVWVTNDTQQDCPKLTTTSCHWDKRYYSHGLSYTILIEVNYMFKNKLLEQAGKIIRIDSDKKVEPAPVENLKAVPNNSSCIVLIWQVPNVFLRSKKFVQQIRAPKGNWTDIRTGISSYTHQHNSSHESWVCDLEPHTGYDFRIAVYPISVLDGQKTGFRSQWRSVFARTEEDVPSAAPRTCPGCYFDLGDTNQGSDMSHTSRKVRVMWKDIPEAARRGRLTHFTVSFVGLDSNQNGSIICAMTNTEPSATSVLLELPSRHENYRVRIVGATSKGESPFGSFILVPALEKRPQPPKRFLVKRNKDARGSERLFLSWAALGSVPSERSASPGHHKRPRRLGAIGRPVKNLYILWCQGNRISWQCEDEVKWVLLPPEQVTYELVTDLTQVDPYDLLIGISVQERDGANIMSSGVHWSTCVYTRDQKPQTAPLNVRISPTSTKADSLVVLWERRECHEETSYITEYLVRYCPSSSNDVCVGDRTAVNVSSDVTSATLPHLARSTKYLIHVVAASSAGLGPPSQNIWHMLDPKPPDEDVSGLIAVVLSIISVVVVLTLLFCFVRYCYRRRKKVPTVNKLLEIPTPQKCHPVNHYRGRPLPEPPANDVLVDYHTYGTSSDLACMKNLGSDKVDHSTESGYCSQDRGKSNIPLMAEHFNEDHGTSMENGEVLQIVPEKVNLIQAVDWQISNDNDSSISTTLERTSSHSPTHTTDTYLRQGLEGFVGSVENVPVAFLHQPVEWLSSFEHEDKNFTTTDTLPYRSHWSAFANTEHHHNLPDNTKNLDFDSSTALFPGMNQCALSYVVAGSAFSPDAPNYTVNFPVQTFNHEAASNQEFCTCDCDSGDSLSDELNENMLLFFNNGAYPEANRRPSVPIEAIFSRIPPPPGPPSPAPPHVNAPPLPADSKIHFPTNHTKQNSTDAVPDMGSQEYLEPQFVSSGYVTSVAS